MQKMINNKVINSDSAHRSIKFLLQCVLLTTVLLTSIYQSP